MIDSFNAADICLHAASLVGGGRQQQHGGPTENHANIASLWSAYLGVRVDAHQAAMMMALLKIARTKSGSVNRDDYVDLAGYAGCAAEIRAANRDSEEPRAVHPSDADHPVPPR